MYEVVSMQTPGRPRAIVVAAAILLAATMALAATAVWARDLGAPVHLDGWALTFRPPKGWTSEGPQEDGYGATVTYSEPGDQGAGRELRLSRRNNPKGLPAEQLCRTLVQGLFARQVGPLRSLFHRPAVSYERRPLGPCPAFAGWLLSRWLCVCTWEPALDRTGRAKPTCSNFT